MKTIRLHTAVLVVTLASAVLCSCSGSDEETGTPSGGTSVEVEGTGLTEALEASYSNSVNDFAFDAFRLVARANSDGSVVISPVSIASVVAMLNNGATGQTRGELLGVLGFGSDGTLALNEFFHKLMVTAPEADTSTTLRLSNAAYAASGSSFRPVFAKTVGDYYQAETATLDFTSLSALSQINDWCSRQTEGMIPQMLTFLSPATRSLLLNAVYFSGKWVTPFSSTLTKEAVFTREDGTETAVPMMGMEDGHGGLNDYYETTGYQAVRMAYGQRHYAMTIILPKKGLTSVADVIASLTNDSWEELNAKLSQPSRKLYINLPRFSVETQPGRDDISEVLKEMGARSMFQVGDELGGILENENLLVSSIFHKGIIRVTEEGTEAAAVTVDPLLMDDIHAPAPIYFTANHPFVFVISDLSNNVVYFIGAYQG